MSNPLYTISGIVIHGEGRGDGLGFPTANIPMAEEVPEGTYAAKVIIDDQTYLAATFAGTAETFQRKERYIESYLFDFTGDLYGKKITVKLYKKLRNNKKFASADALVKQIELDIKEIRKFFS